MASHTAASSAHCATHRLPATRAAVTGSILWNGTGRRVIVDSIQNALQPHEVTRTQIQSIYLIKSEGCR